MIWILCALPVVLLGSLGGMFYGAWSNKLAALWDAMHTSDRDRF